MRRSLIATAAIILVVLASCGDSAIFLSPVEEPAEVRVESIPAGSIVQPGSEVPFAIARDPVFTGDPESADRLVVELVDTDGVLLGEQVYESVDQAETLPALLLPDVGAGLFVLRTSYFDGDILIESDEIPFFIASGSYAINGLSTYPATVYPGSTGLLSLSIEYPVGANPYIAWFVDDQPVESGPLSEIGYDVEVQAPETSGSYTVQAHLFPGDPSVNGIETPPVVTYSSELLVTTDVTLDESSLKPERNYFALYHMLGNLRDAGARVAMFPEYAVDGMFIGEPGVAVEPDIFGYRFSGEDGAHFEGFPFPVRSGELGPFSVTVRLRPDELYLAAAVDSAEPAGERSILAVHSADERVFQISHDQNGALIVNLGGETVSSEPALVPGKISVLTVTVMPLGEFTLVQVYLDGELLASEPVEWDARDFSMDGELPETEDGWSAGEGYAVVAGPGGFAGIVDEFGVYFRDEGDQPSPDTDIFRSAMEQVLGDKLVYAEGFESTVIPDAIEVDGEISLDGGRLLLEAGSSVLFPVFGFSSEELLVTVSIEESDASQITFYAGDAAILELDGIESSGDLEFRFIHSAPRLSAVLPGSEWEDTELIDIELDPGEFDGLRLEVGRDVDAAQVAIRSVVAWRENPELPRLILEPEPEETN